MRLLKLKFGLLISNKIQLFYDVPDDKEAPIKVFETEFKSDDKKGLTFIKLFDKDNFHIIKLENFCESKVEEILDKEIAENIVKDIIDNKQIYIEKFSNLISQELKNTYNENILKIVNNNLDINLYHKKNKKRNDNLFFNPKLTENMEKKEKLPIIIIPDNIDEFKRQFIEKGKAYIYYYYEDGKIEREVWNKRRFSISSNLLGNLRSREIARDGLWKKKGINKLVVSIDLI